MKCQICKKETNHLIPFPVHNKTMKICLICFKEQTVTRKEMLKAKKETEKISRSLIGRILRLKPFQAGEP